MIARYYTATVYPANVTSTQLFKRGYKFLDPYFILVGGSADLLYSITTRAENISISCLRSLFAGASA